MKKNKLSGFTLIEMIFVLMIGSALSIGIFTIFLSSTKQLNEDDVMNDLKSYASLSMEIISDKIRNADQTTISNNLGSSTISTLFSNGGSGNGALFSYMVVNNIIYENGNPLKLHGYHWLGDQDFYDVELQLQCSSNNVTFFESSDPNLRSTIYDLDIIINIESKLDENYKTTYETNNRIFAINEYSQI